MSQSVPWWIRQPAGLVAWTAATTWARTQRTRTIGGWITLAALTATTTLAATAAAAIVITATAPIALPAHALALNRPTITLPRPAWTRPPGTRPTRGRSEPTRRWPERPAPVTEAIRRFVDRHRRPGIPDPVTVYAGRHEAAIVWRPDVETFAAYITRTNPNGGVRAVWLGTHAAQYPTIDALTEALNSYGIDLDPASQRLARSYQHDIWATIGPCTITATQTNGLLVTTPNGQTRRIEPAPVRDQRSKIFGPLTALGWGPGDPRGNLETARCLLDYTTSTSRTPQQLFDDARELALTTTRTWPPNTKINIADLHNWATARTPIHHQQAPTNPIDHNSATRAVDHDHTSGHLDTTEPAAGHEVDTGAAPASRPAKRWRPEPPEIAVSL